MDESRNSSSLETKLLNSDAVHSLLMEREVSQVLKLHDWNVTDNPYYLDQQTRKHRELDVFGRVVCHLENKEITIDLQLLIECKSLQSFHIVVTNKTEFYSADRDTIWVGDAIIYKHKLRSLLFQLGFSEPEYRHFLEEVKIRYYPNDTWILSDLLPNFFQDLSCFHSFRETNIGKEKELDNSVIWRSFLSLKSINTAIKKKNWRNVKEDIRYHFEEEKEFEKRKLDTLFECIDFYLRSPDLIHPIVVIDAALWELTNDDQIVKIPYCRLIQTNLYGITDFWIDIVTREHFPNYFENLSKHYKSRFARLTQEDMVAK